MAAITPSYLNVLLAPSIVSVREGQHLAMPERSPRRTAMAVTGCSNRRLG